MKKKKNQQQKQQTNTSKITNSNNIATGKLLTIDLNFNE